MALGGAMVMLAGCSGYLAPPLAEFEADILAAHPVGSPAADLDRAMAARPGFRKGGPVDIGPDVLPVCWTRDLAFGFWAAGWRSVCLDAEATGAITVIEVRDRIAGL